MKVEKDNQCAIVQDLLPIYSDGELSSASTQLVEEHLAACQTCQEELAFYQKLLFEQDVIVPGKIETVKSVFLPFFLFRWQRFVWIGILVLVIGTGSLAWATYQAGKNIRHGGCLKKVIQSNFQEINWRFY